MAWWRKGTEDHEVGDELVKIRRSREEIAMLRAEEERWER